MRQVDVLSIQRVSADERASIEAADPAVRLVDAGGWSMRAAGSTAKSAKPGRNMRRPVTRRCPLPVAECP
jgi:hypothetical protein